MALVIQDCRIEEAEGLADLVPQHAELFITPTALVHRYSFCFLFDSITQNQV